MGKSGARNARDVRQPRTDRYRGLSKVGVERLKRLMEIHTDVEVLLDQYEFHEVLEMVTGYVLSKEDEGRTEYTGVGEILAKAHQRAEANHRERMRRIEEEP